MNNLIQSLSLRSQLYQELSNDGEFMVQVRRAAEVLQQTITSGALILVCGNGGSAAEAGHMVGEIVGRFQVEREGLPALTLPADAPTMTAIGNDYGFDEVFARQVTAYKNLAKVLVLLSTSGNSKNLVKAAVQAKTHGLTSIGLLGRDGGLLKNLCDIPVVVPSWSTPEIQEVHLTLIHLICSYIDENLSRDAS